MNPLFPQIFHHWKPLKINACLAWAFISASPWNHWCPILTLTLAFQTHCYFLMHLINRKLSNKLLQTARSNLQLSTNYKWSVCFGCFAARTKNKQKKPKQNLTNTKQQQTSLIPPLMHWPLRSSKYWHLLDRRTYDMQSNIKYELPLCSKKKKPMHLILTAHGSEDARENSCYKNHHILLNPFLTPALLKKIGSIKYCGINYK